MLKDDNNKCEKNNGCITCPVDFTLCPSRCHCKACGKYLQWLVSELNDIVNCRVDVACIETKK